jgi:hypothetical protein
MLILPHRYMLKCRGKVTGTHYANPALLPEELNPILKHAEPTSRWRHFACFLYSERAKELCKEWHNAVN